MRIKRYLDQWLDNPVLFNSLREIIDGGQTENIARILTGFPHTRVVDIACGTGEMSKAVSVDYVGIDLCETFITFARRKHGGQRKTFLVMDVTDITLPSKSFDLAMIVNVIHHFRDEEVVQILRRATELSRERVLLIDAIPQRNWVSRTFYALDRGAHFRSIEEQKALVERAQCLKLSLEGTFDSTSRIYKHSVLLSDVQS